MYKWLAQEGLTHGNASILAPVGGELVARTYFVSLSCRTGSVARQEGIRIKAAENVNQHIYSILRYRSNIVPLSTFSPLERKLYM